MTPRSPGDERKQTVSSFFARASTVWEDNYTGKPGEYGVHFFAQRRERVVQALGERDGQAILDLGCASGDLSFALALGGASVTGVDLTKEMVHRAEARRRAAGEEFRAAAGRTAFAVADAENLPFPDATFDAATCVGVLEYVPDDVKGARELYRILKPGGRLVITAPHRASPILWTELGLFAIAGLFKRRAPGAFHRNYSERRLRHVLEGAGFSMRSCRFVSYLPYNLALRLPNAAAIDRSLRGVFERGLLERLGVTMVLGAEKPFGRPGAGPSVSR